MLILFPRQVPSTFWQKGLEVRKKVLKSLESTLLWQIVLTCERLVIPMRKQMESRMLLLPDPLRPVMALKAGSKPLISVRWPYDLKPSMTIDLIYMLANLSPQSPKERDYSEKRPQMEANFIKLAFFRSIFFKFSKIWRTVVVVAVAVVVVADSAKLGWLEKKGQFELKCARQIYLSIQRSLFSLTYNPIQ